MYERGRPAPAPALAPAPGHDSADPDPWLALELDGVLPIDRDAKAALIASQRSRSRQFLLPLARPAARLAIMLVQLLRIVAPKRPASSRLLHRLIAWGMGRFVRPEANLLILRHFHLGAEILGFIADNATPGFRPALAAMRPQAIADVRDELFLRHDLNIYNFLIALNEEMARRGTAIGRCDRLDFSAISDAPPAIDRLPAGRLNRIDLETAVELYTPLYGLLLSDRDFGRAANSLQLDETIALYAARLTGCEQHLALVNNRHPLIPLATLGAGHRLMLHGLATETLHGFLRQQKALRAAEQG